MEKSLKRVYTVVPAIILGTSGPYFEDPIHAIIYGFLKYSNEEEFIPQNVNLDYSQRHLSRGKVFKEWLFANDEYVLLEIYLDQSQDVLKLDGTDNYYFEKYLKQCNVDNIQRIIYYNPPSYVTPLELPHVFIKENGKIDYNATIKLIHKYIEIPLHDFFPQTGLYICNPQDLITKRFTYPINVEFVWIAAMPLLKESDPMMLYGNIKKIIKSILGKKKEIPLTTYFPKDLIIPIVESLDNYDDIRSLCLVNSKFYALCQNPVFIEALKMRGLKR